MVVPHSNESKYIKNLKTKQMHIKHNALATNPVHSLNNVRNIVSW